MVTNQREVVRALSRTEAAIGQASPTSEMVDMISIRLLLIVGLLSAFLAPVSARAQDAAQPSDLPEAAPRARVHHRAPKPPGKATPARQAAQQKSGNAPTALAASTAVAAAQSDPPGVQAANSPQKIWEGAWKLSLGGKVLLLTLRDRSIGMVGGVVEGSLIMDGASCETSGLWYNSLTGVYPNGDHIDTTALVHLLELTANCPTGHRASISMFFTPNGKEIVGAAGRIDWSDASGKIESTDIAIINR